MSDKTYQVKVKKDLYQNYPKSYVCCELSEGIPKKKKRDFEKPRTPGNGIDDTSEKIDIYYFDHGNSAYYRTTDAPPILATEKCAERTDYIATRFWAEIFGTIHIGIAFVTAFILQLIRFLLFSIVRPLTVGVVQLIADYFLKPSLSMLFNATIQPVLILLYNIATSFRDLCEPIAEGLGFFLREIAQVFRAFRIVEVNNCTNNSCT
ncbi:uncharacterized protein LOC107228222 [Neodiprion lecontei]|uniref:Uncharacterized protein LOC107228222 n=1 Tax=Neodiprion lecontei TaxID=441921 RepID=A0ABM3GFK8_NEOLC|nr:uncharacterized protein LOC107228222 [Neodiprion lecontei]